MLLVREVIVLEMLRSFGPKQRIPAPSFMNHNTNAGLLETCPTHLGLSDTFRHCCSKRAAAPMLVILKLFRMGADVKTQACLVVVYAVESSACALNRHCYILSPGIIFTSHGFHYHFQEVDSHTDGTLFS